jgi:small subunit ribosomal protein S3Ae
LAVTKAEGWKSKNWYSIIAPEILGKATLGETVADEAEKLIGRTVEITLGELTNDFSKQNIKLELKIDKVAGDLAYTKFLGHQLTQDYQRSLVKRQTSCIDTNIEVETKDGYKVRVKPSCYTIKRAKANQVKAIRQIMNNVIINRAKELDLNQFIQEIVMGKLSANIYRDVKSIYPLRRVEIKKTRIEAEPGQPAAS